MSLGGQSHRDVTNQRGMTMLRAEDNQNALYEYLGQCAQDAFEEHKEWMDENFGEEGTYITGCEPEQDYGD